MGLYRRSTPALAETPATGQESVWDYSRPPKLVVDHRRIVVQRGDLLIADSRENYRILESFPAPAINSRLLKRYCDSRALNSSISSRLESCRRSRKSAAATILCKLQNHDEPAIKYFRRSTRKRFYPRRAGA